MKREKKKHSKEKEKNKKHSTQLKFTRSFPAQRLSKLNKTTQAATYQSACMPGLFFLSLPHVCECDREASQPSVESNIRNLQYAKNSYISQIRTFVMESV